MKSINLLPRKPLIHHIFLPVLIGILSVSTLVFLLMLYSISKAESSILKTEEKLTSVEQRINQLTADRQVDPLTHEFNTFQTQINDLKKIRRFWPSTLLTLSSNLPAASRILTTNADDKDMLQVSAEFQSLSDIADYLIMLQRSGTFETLTVKSINRYERVNGNGNTVSTPTNTPTPAAQPSTPAVKNPAPSTIPVPKNTGETLLSELEQIMAKKLDSSSPNPPQQSNTGSSQGATVTPAPSYNVTVFALVLEAKLKPNMTK